MPVQRFDSGSASSMLNPTSAAPAPGGEVYCSINRCRVMALRTAWPSPSLLKYATT